MFSGRENPDRPSPYRATRRGAYTIDTEGCRQTYETLKTHGVEFDKDVLKTPWGYLAVFQDPDGNRLQVREVRLG